MLKRKVDTSMDVTNSHADDGNEGTSELKKSKGKLVGIHSYNYLLSVERVNVNVEEMYYY